MMRYFLLPVAILIGLLIAVSVLDVKRMKEGKNANAVGLSLVGQGMEPVLKPALA